jgi:hypothetical protein
MNSPVVTTPRRRHILAQTTATRGIQMTQVTHPMSQNPLKPLRKKTMRKAWPPPVYAAVSDRPMIHQGSLRSATKYASMLPPALRWKAQATAISTPQ